MTIAAIRRLQVWTIYLLLIIIFQSPQ